jgi:hypothetical protein
MARGPEGNRSYLVKWVGRNEKEKDWEHRSSLPPNLVAAFERAARGKSVIEKVLQSGKVGGWPSASMGDDQFMVLDSHNQHRWVDRDAVPLPVLNLWEATQASEEARKRETEKFHWCKAGWCNRHGPSSEGRASSKPRSVNNVALELECSGLECILEY